MPDLLSGLTSGIGDAFKGIAPPNVNTSQTTTTVAPTAYNNFLSTLGATGVNALDPTNTLQGNLNAGAQYVAPLSQLQNDIYGTTKGQTNTANLLKAGLDPLTAGATTATNASGNIGASQINNFLNPYTNAVNRNLETNTAQNINQSILPALQAMGVSSGSTGSQRLMNATGQTLGGIQQGLGAQESANMSQAYKDAVTQALQQQQNLGQIAGIQGNIGKDLESSTIQGLNAQASLGAQGQAQQQAMINAPLSTASNVSSLLKGYTIPTTSNQTYSGPATSYGASPLAQIAGLASLFGTTTAGGTSAIQGLKNAFGLTDSSLKLNPATAVDPSGYGSPVQGIGVNNGAGAGQILGTDGKVYTDPSYGTGNPSMGVQYNGGMPPGFEMDDSGMYATNSSTGQSISLF
jgi:hypothetical protein